MSGRGQRSPLRAVLAAAMLAVIAACGDVPVTEHVVARLDDLLFAPKSRLQHSTALYPRHTVADDTRVVLHSGAGTATRDGWREHAVVEVDVPADAALDLAWAIDGKEAARSAARLRVETMSESGTREMLIEDTITAATMNAWKELRIPALRRGPARLIFSTHVSADGRAWVAAPVLVARMSQAQRPNIVLVSLDTLRAQQLPLYGNARPLTPNIDRLFGAGGVVVDQVLSASADTIGGHMAMLEGVNRCLVHMPMHKHSPAVRSLAEALRAHGYRTASFNEDGMLVGADGFHRGFESWFEDRSTDQAVGHIEQTFARGMAWLERNRDKQFFLFLHTYEVHGPYEPPAAMAQKFGAPADAPLPQRELAAYEGEIAHVDEHVARLVARLAELGLERDTILVVTSDHGEEFGEHGRRFHGSNLTQEILRVPLLLRAPGMLPEGARRTGSFALLDLPPTLLDLVALPAFPEMEGRSLAELIRSGAEVETQPIWAEAWSRMAMTYDGPDATWRSPSVAVTRWPWRMVRLNDASGGARYRLFDLQADPGEKTDRFSEKGAEMGEMKTALDGYLKDCARRQRELASRLGQQEAPADEDAADPQHEEKLRALGYLQ